MRHLERYRAGPAIAFEVGGADRHIPKENACAFVDALRDAHATPPDRLRVNVHAGLDHLGVTTSAEALDGAARWLLAE